MDETNTANANAGASLAKQSIDLGIVVSDGPACLEFYRGVLGLLDLGESPMPGGTMHRLGCGSSTIKLITTRRTPPATAAPGGIQGSTGFRYFTISVRNLDDLVQLSQSAGRTIAVPPTEVRPGVRIAMIEDPDGNWVELLEEAV